MNKVILKGCIVRDPELTFAANKGTAIAKFTIAIPRMKKEDPSDFINCVAFGKTGELIANKLRKGSPILLEGRIQTGSYENKEGRKVYTTDIIVDRFEFLYGKEGANFNQASNEDMTKVEDMPDLPF